MERSSLHRGMTSLRWFLLTHTGDLPEDLASALGQLSDTDDSATDQVRNLTCEQLEQLCSTVETLHRSYFGTMKGRELSSFLHQLGTDKSMIQW